MTTQAEKGLVFRGLHERSTAFIIPNPWDVGSARVLESMGFEALATTSMGYAFSMGRLDATIGRDEMLAHIATIANATSLPVNADLENGYGDDPQTVAETIRLAAVAGVVGGSIEDATGRSGDPIYSLDVAVERVRAAVAAARALPFPFTLTARAENYLHGRPDLNDTIQRLQAFEAAGADVLYAPGLRTRDDIEAVVKSVQKPVNILMGLQGVVLSLGDLTTIGARRISVGSALYRAAMGEFLRAANQMRHQGTFGFAADAANPRDLAAIFGK
jgi:2-methylisocitrate lyase-like PEP mutase family enzyme